MRRADRLFDIIQILRGGKLFTANSLAEQLEVSKRTIYRDIADLMASGVPIEGEAGVGYMMREGFDVPPLMFTPSEITSLVAGARIVRAWGGENMTRSAQSALEKIEQVLPDELQSFAQEVSVHAMNPFMMDDQLRARLDLIEQAEKAKLKLSIHYQDQNEERSVRLIHPLGLVFWGKLWTLVAWCELRDDFRSFRVDRILSLEEAGKFEPSYERSFSAFLALECVIEEQGDK